MFGHSKRGQTIVEYTLLLGVLAAAVIGVQTYVKRAIQAAVKVSADQLGSQEKGLRDIDLRDNLGRKFKGNSLVLATSSSRRETRANADGSTSFDVETDALSSGNLNRNGTAQP